MRIDFNNITPVYMQIAEAIEDDIISGQLEEGGAAYSQLILSKELGINPATAAKGINVLVAKGILEKQRGASMTVAYGALEHLINERRERKIGELAGALVTEAGKLRLTEEEVIEEIRKRYE